MSTLISSLPHSSVSAQPLHTGSRSASALAHTHPACEQRTAGELAGFQLSAATERLRMQVRTIAPHFRTALITGERGARKEEVARSLHAASPVGKGPFVVCDSGWLETLLRNSGKSDARSAEDRSVCRNLARTGQGGTIFFPELQLCSCAAQLEVLYLLNCLESERGQRVRVIASVSGDLQAMVAGGTLRSELREKLGGIELSVAPLRERLGDFAAVAARILAQIAWRSGGEAATISEGALRELQRRGWPGNDRELESALCMAALTSGGALIEERHLPPPPEESEQTERPAGPAISYKEKAWRLVMISPPGRP